MSTKQGTNPTPFSWQVTGMTCANCAKTIENFLDAEGAEKVVVDFASDEVMFEIISPERKDALIQGIENLGYRVEEEVEEELQPRFSLEEKLFAFCLVFTLPLLLSMVLPFPVLHNAWVQLGLTIPVFLVGISYFGRSAWHSLKSWPPNMDVLIILGAIAAFGYSLYGTLFGLGHDFLFYETAAGIITIVLLGNSIEKRAIRKTTSAVQQLNKLKAIPALRIRYHEGNEIQEKVPQKAIKKNDLLLVKAGERIPADGTIEFGEGSVDESLISGESIPIDKQTRDTVIGGTALATGTLHIRVTASRNETVLSQIIDLVKQAQADKPAIHKLADQISGIFVPVVIGIALLTFALSYWVFDISIQASIIHAVAVLVISCPCAMGLATPTAIVVGIGKASQKGILIKGGSTLETLNTLRYLVFDKTGTLTTGNFKISAIHCDPTEKKLVKDIAYSLELHASHPIAKSMVTELKDARNLALRDVKEHKGVGMEGKDGKGNLYQLGSFRIAKHLTEEQSHALYLLKNDKLLATFDLADTLRPGAHDMIAFLKDKGIIPVMLSGDRKDRCKAVADELGIETVYAEQLPADKLTLIEQLSAEAPTAMMGDGLNDAPALARATLGISLGNATEVAIQAAQVVLLRDDLSVVKDLFGVGKHTVLTIKQNLFWAFAYNIVAIPMAALGFLTPLVGVFAMAFSDIVVIGNSLRLKVKKV